MRCFGFTTGLLSGVLLGVLFAPEKGEVTRKKLSNEMGACKRKVDRLIGEGDTALKELKLALEDETTELTAELRQKLLKLVRQAKRQQRFQEDPNIETT